MNLEDRIEIEEIRRLEHRYVRLMDTKQWDALAALWAEDLDRRPPPHRNALGQRRSQHPVRRMTRSVSPLTRAQHRPRR